MFGLQGAEIVENSSDCNIENIWILVIEGEIVCDGRRRFAR